MSRKQTRDADGSVYWRAETRIVNGRKKSVRQYYARVRWKEFFLDAAGILKSRNKEKKRRATSHSHAVELRRTLRDEVKAELEKAEKPPEPGERTFAEMAAWYKEKYLVEPRYVGDRKVSGLESWKSQRAIVDLLVKHFGEFTLREITHELIEEYRQLRLADAARRLAATVAQNEACFAAKKSKNKKKKKLSDRFFAQNNVTAVNRELQRLRAMLNKAIPKWLAVNPFQGGDALITLSQEEGRDRIMRRGEESLLLAQCVAERAHLYTAIIFALDTAMRQTEQFRVTWSCVDWLNNVITLKSKNTKGKRKRVVPVTKRLRPLLVELYEYSDKNLKSRLFPFTTFKHSFNTARDRAGISDLLWRDLRATAITWMLDAGLEEAKVMKIVGHTNYRTFLKYVRMSIELAQEAGEKMDRRRAELERAGKFAVPN